MEQKLSVDVYDILKVLWDSNCQTIDVEIKAYSRLMNEDEISKHVDKAVKHMLEKLLSFYSTQTSEQNVLDIVKVLKKPYAQEVE